MPVTSVSILQGEVLADDLIIVDRFVANALQLQNLHNSRECVLGKVARSVVPAVHAFPIIAVREALVFLEGERVSIVFAVGGLSIEATGIALEPGIAGKFISVRNADTGIVVRGVVHESGRVQVGRD
jgi:flagella basal body P-ring formation protein FlgA